MVLVLCVAALCALSARPPVVASTVRPLLEEALRCSTAVRNAQTRVDVLLGVAEVAGRSGDSGLVERALTDAADVCVRPDAPDGLLKKVALASARTGRLHLASATAQKLENEVARTEILLGIADVLIDSAERSKALETLEEVAWQAGSHPEPRRRAAWMLSAADRYARLERPKEAKQLTVEALNAAYKVEDPAQADALVARAALARAEAGDCPEARSMAAEIATAPRQARTLLKLSGLCGEEGRETPDQRLLKRAMAAAEQLQPRPRLEAIAEGAAWLAERGREGNALQLARMAEEALKDIPLHPPGSPDIRRVAELYEQLGRWEDSARVASKIISRAERERIQSNSILRLASLGRLDAAQKLFEQMPSDSRRRVPDAVSRKLAEVYARLHENATLGQIVALESEEFRDAAAAVYARKAAAEGNYSQALRMALSISRANSRGTTLQEIATAALENASPSQMPGAADLTRKALAETFQRGRRLGLLVRLARKHLEFGEREATEHVMREITVQLDEIASPQQRTGGLLDLAILSHGLGDRLSALPGVGAAIVEAYEINCKSCRDTVLDDAFRKLCRAGGPELVAGALAIIPEPENRLKQSLRALSELPELSTPEKRQFLQGALATALRSPLPRRRATGLTDTAGAYVDHGLEPGTAAREMIESLEPASPQTSHKSRALSYRLEVHREKLPNHCPTNPGPLPGHEALTHCQPFTGASEICT